MKFVSHVLRAGLILLFLVSGAAWWLTGHLADRLLTVPLRPLQDYHVARLESPENFSLQLQPLTFRAEDGVSLHAILVRADPDSGQGERFQRMRARLRKNRHVPLPAPGEIRGTLFLLHGRGGRKEDALPIAERFVAAGFQCVGLDSRAHGESEGRYCTFGALESWDLSRILDQWPGRILEPAGVYGVSMGGSTALLAAVRDERISAAVTVGTFADLDRTIRPHVEKRFPHLGPCLLPLIRQSARSKAGVCVFTAPAEAITRLTIPVMIVHGGDDRFIDPSHARLLHARSRHPASRLRMVPSGNHHNTLAAGGDALYEETIEFFYRQMCE